MSLRTASVSKCLDKKLLVCGFEVPDLFIVFSLLSVLNLLFGQTHLRFTLVWLPTVAFAVAIRIGKRGKPDNYLLHLLKFHLRPRYLSAFSDPTIFVSPPRLKRPHA